MPRDLPIPGAALFLVIGLASLASAVDSHSDPVSESQIRSAIERSLPSIEASGVAWMKSKNCVSCHNVPFLLWSHNLAKSRGIKVDETKLVEWTEWAAEKSLERRGPFEFTDTGLEKLRNDGVSSSAVKKLRLLIGSTFKSQGELNLAMTKLRVPELENNAAAVLKRTWPASRPATTDGGGLDTMAQLLLARSSDYNHNSKITASWAELVATTSAMIIAWQEDDGRWKAAGQLPRQERTAGESDAVATRWAILALASVPESPANTAAIDRALEALKKSKETRSSESLITALLIARRLSAKAGDEKALLADLLKRQNTDGGWAWLDGAPSDAFATGQALYALGTVGGESTKKPIARGQGYLLRTQQQDGGWPVTRAGVTSAKSTPARLKKVEPIYRHWGTAWAAIGLAATLPEAKQPAKSE
jgi:hypothetical protein